ncbi:MAG: phage holin family protein [Gaiellaceae bacterium]
MPTSETESPGLGGAAKQVAEHASTLARLELELAALELKRKVAALGIGIATAIGAGLFLLLAVGFGLAAGAAALATTLSTWLALLIVAGGLVLLAGVLGAIGAAAIRRGTPPVPKQAIDEAKLTTQALRSDGR